MFKEISLAVILGGLLGVGLTGGFITLKNQGKVPQFSQLAAAISPVLSPSPADQVNLTPAPTKASAVPLSPSPLPLPETETSAVSVTNFKSGEIVNTSKVSLKGSAPANSQIVLVAPQSTSFAQVTTEGTYEIDVQLETGFNQLEITAIDPADNQHQMSFNLTYSTAKI